ncbi:MULTISPECIES: ABC transporter permease [unclassified Streptomyces]|uniref:ABC transporter permease n=1 Tax=Streptomyces johnsoniae TaxID=3075532 RepID=A0ABU2S0P8_9ACTN|nr:MULTISPECIES: ABC transporter permease [unclassified Streptomyces]MDT0442581.1 ABC transporter permease [Streptomyces sp. DSM 41886]ONK15946.1 Ribose transport system permease protein RbsC [Streptomyces sp. MP131-18]
MTTLDSAVPRAARRARLLALLGTGLPVYALLGALLVALAFTDPGFYEPDRFLAFIRRAAPLVLLAAGQYLVIVCGQFDLSVGAVVTAGVVVAAEIYAEFPGAHWLVVCGALLLAGAAVGLVNGLVTTGLGVPSFITTLGMMLILEGGVFFWTGGSPQGYLPDDFRAVGRDDVLGRVPWAVLVCLAVGVAAVLLMRSRFGRTLVATGDSERTAALAGVRVHRARTVAFVLSGAAAALAAVLVGGFSGVSAQAGTGMEFEAITAVVLGGVLLGGGRGSVVGAMAGAFSLTALFTLLNLQGVSGALESTVQGVIVIAAVALGAADWSRLRRRSPSVPSGGPRS